MVNAVTDPMPYDKMLAKTRSLSEEMIRHIKRQEMRDAMDVSQEIGAIYAPDNHIQAGRIAYLTLNLAMDAFYAGQIAR
jgi:hypothetical protein